MSDEKTQNIASKHVQPSPASEPEPVEGLSRQGLLKLLGLAGVLVVGSFGLQQWATSQAGTLSQESKKPPAAPVSKPDPEGRKESFERQLAAQERQREEESKRDEEARSKLTDAEAQAAKAVAPASPSVAQPVGAPRPSSGTPAPNAAPSPWAQARKQYQAEIAKQFYERRVRGSLDVLTFEDKRSPVQASEAARPASRPPGAGPSEEEMRQAQALATRYGVGTPPAASGPRQGPPSLEDRQEDYFARDFEVKRSPTRPPGSRVVPAGTLIHVRLVTGIQTDLPGHILGEVLRDVWDETSSHVVLASGTRVFGQYNTRLEWGQDRAQIRWTHARLLDGRTLGLKRAHGVDLGGMAGIRGKVDNHLGEVFLGGALSALTQGATGAAAGPQSAFQVNPGQQALTGAGQGASNVGNKLSDKYLSLEPTLTVAPGRVIGMYLDSDLVIPSRVR